MNSAGNSAANFVGANWYGGPVATGGRPSTNGRFFDRPAPYDPRNRMPVTRPRDDVKESLMNTVTQARERKRQREEALFSHRSVGTQTVRFGWENGRCDVERHDPIADGNTGMSMSRRIYREDVIPVEPDREFENVGTNTSHAAYPTLSCLQFVNPIRERSAEELDLYGPHPSLPSSSALAPDNVRQAQRVARRAARTRRNHQHTAEIEAMRQQFAEDDSGNPLQQIRGIVPRGEHVCTMSCCNGGGTNGEEVSQPGLLPNGMTVAQLVRPEPLYSLGVVGQMSSIPGTPLAYQHMPMLRMANSHWNQYFDPTLMAIYAMQGEPLFPNMEVFGLDRHHMFAPFESDIPVGATQNDITAFTKSDNFKKTEGNGEEETCTVCLCAYEDGENITNLPCNHFFHTECIEKWLKLNKKCPMCRVDIDQASGRQRVTQMGN
ncbi:unnamed protein product [Caenorhabditis sp. 36 PRJEB53466]|nr:unnamed protein product [Caenorhabditis sp. 36 PRJEB53466]